MKKDIKKQHDKNKVLSIILKILNGIVYFYALILTIALVVGSCSSRKQNKASSDNESFNINNYSLVTQNKPLYSGDYTYYMNWEDGPKSLTLFDKAILPSLLGGVNPSTYVDRSFVYDLADYDFYVFVKGKGHEAGGLLVKSITFYAGLLDHQVGTSHYSYEGIISVKLLVSADYYHSTDFEVEIAKRDGLSTNSDFIQVVGDQYDLYVTTQFSSNNVLQDQNDVIITKFLGYRVVNTVYLDIYPYVNIGLGYSNRSIACSSSTEHAPNVGNLLFKYYLWVGPFVTNDECYNVIILTYRLNDGTEWYTDTNNIVGGENIKHVGANTYTFLYGQYAWATGSFGSQSPYVDELGSTTFIQRTYYLGKDNTTNPSTQSYCYTKGINYTLENYQVLDVLGSNDSYEARVGLNNLAFFSRGATVSINEDGSSASLYDVFEIFALAITSISGLFNIMLLPGISIGLLIVMPLTVTIIIIVVRLIKL